MIAVLACVLLSQWLALAHSLVHAPGLAWDENHEAVVAPGESVADLLHELVAGHDGGTDVCRLLDSHAHDMVPVAHPTGALLHVHPEAALAPTQRDVVRVAWRRYLSRAPPVLA